MIQAYLWNQRMELVKKANEEFRGFKHNLRREW